MTLIVQAQIIGISLAAALLVELVAWLVIYRRPVFRSLSIEAESLAAKQKIMVAAGNDKGKKRVDDQMLTLGARIFAYKMGYMFINMVFLAVTWRLVTKMYSGNPVARLPFRPPGFMLRATHAGLDGDDPTECSSHFIYILSQMAIKGGMNKFVNVAATQALNKFGQQTMMKKIAKLD